MRHLFRLTPTHQQMAHQWTTLMKFGALLSSKTAKLRCEKIGSYFAFHCEPEDPTTNCHMKFFKNGEEMLKLSEHTIQIHESESNINVTCCANHSCFDIHADLFHSNCKLNVIPKTLLEETGGYEIPYILGIVTTFIIIIIIIGVIVVICMCYQRLGNRSETTETVATY